MYHFLTLPGQPEMMYKNFIPDCVHMKVKRIAVYEVLYPYSVWCSTNPSVIRGLLEYAMIISWVQENFNSPQRQFIPAFPMKPCEN